MHFLKFKENHCLWTVNSLLHYHGNDNEVTNQFANFNMKLGTSCGRKLANWVGYKQEISMADQMALFSDKLENDLISQTLTANRV